eukprot:5828759-Pleurochrysis_carterae.AAC.1
MAATSVAAVRPLASLTARLALCSALLALLGGATGRGMPTYGKAYKPHRRHPELFDAAAGWARWCDPQLLAALEDLK